MSCAKKTAPQLMIYEDDICETFEDVSHGMNHVFIGDIRKYVTELVCYAEDKLSKDGIKNKRNVALCCWTILTGYKTGKSKHTKVISLKDFYDLFKDSPVQSFQALARKYNWRLEGQTYALGYNKPHISRDACVKFGLYNHEDMPGELGKHWLNVIEEDL